MANLPAKFFVFLVTLLIKKTTQNSLDFVSFKNTPVGLLIKNKCVHRSKFYFFEFLLFFFFFFFFVS